MLEELNDNSNDKHSGLSFLNKLTDFVKNADLSKEIIAFKDPDIPYKFNKDTLIKCIEIHIQNIPEYINTIYNIKTSIALARSRDINKDDFTDIVEKLETKRLNAHNNAIRGALAINHLCIQYDYPQICPILKGFKNIHDIKSINHNVSSISKRNISDIPTAYRDAIAKWCGEVVNDIYSNRNL